MSLNEFFPIGQDDWSGYDHAAKMHRLGDKLLKDATDDEIKRFALSYKSGYRFDDDDCAELRKPVTPAHVPDNETIREAIDDFISAYET